MKVGDPVILIGSKRGNEMAVVGVHKYRYVGPRPKDGLLKWRCSARKGCSAFVYTGADKSVVRAVSGKHGGGAAHPTQDLKSVHMQALRENCKRMAAVSADWSPESVVRAELEKLRRDHPTVELDYGACLKTVTKAGYDMRRRKAAARREDRPQRTCAADLALQALRDELRRDGQRFAGAAGEPFVRSPRPGERFVCAVTDASVTFLRDRCTELFGETSYARAPQDFSVVYILHGVCPGDVYVPLAYFVLAEPARETLADAWAYLRQLSVDVCGAPFDLQTLHVDFATSTLHEAVKTVFPDARVQGRVFDVTGKWMAKINSDHVLKRAYDDDDCPLGIWLKRIFDLRFMSSDSVPDGFVHMMESCPNLADGTRFSDFVLENYIDGPRCPISPINWAEEPREKPTKTNGPNAFVSPYLKVSLEVFLSNVLTVKQENAEIEIARVIRDWEWN